MKSRTTWLLLAIFAVIAAYFFLFEQKQRESKERERQLSARLLEYGPAAVDSFTLINPEGDTITVARSDSVWMVTDPVVCRGDGPAVDLFVRLVVPGQKLEQYTTVVNLADFGLEEPFATVFIFGSGDRRPDTLSVGDKTPTSSRCYVRLGASKTVYVTRELTHNVMNKNLYHLRDKNFIDFAPETIDSLTVIDGARIASMGTDSGHWWLQEPHVRLDEVKVRAYCNRLTDTIIRGFVREDTAELESYGLARPSRAIILYRAGAPTRISFGDTIEDLVYAVRSGLDKVVLLSADLLVAFEWTADNLRKRNLTFFTVGQVYSFRCETPDTALSVEFLQGRWGVRDNGSYPVSQYETNLFLKKLTQLRFDEIYPEPFTGEDSRLSKPAVTVTLLDQDGTIIDRIIVTASASGAEVGASLTSRAIGRVTNGTIESIMLGLSRIAAQQ